MMMKCAFDSAKYVPSRAASAKVMIAADWIKVSTTAQ